MSDPGWFDLPRVLADTGVFIHWYRGDPRAYLFFRRPNVDIYYTRVTRKELLHPPIRDAERQRILKLLAALRLINPEEPIGSAYAELLRRHPFLHAHLHDALIAASAWVKNLPLVTTNLRHFQPIQEIEVVPF